MRQRCAIVFVISFAACTSTTSGTAGTASTSAASTSGASSGTAGTTSTSSSGGSTTTSGTISLTALPLGDGKISTSPEVGYVYSCQTTFNGQGATGSPPWISDGGTFDFTAKVVVEGSVSWPDASFTVEVDGGTTMVLGNDLPDHATGTFPIATSDPAHQYDGNPNHIAAQALLYSLPSNPTVAANATCLGGGPIGVMFTGSYIYDALDAVGRDALAHEEQDSCQGHPDQSDAYHYHALTECLPDPGTGHSNLLGYALDGFGIYGNRGENGEALTDADLDACHGHTHAIAWNGQSVSLYHYHATKEYPYTLGCYRGTPVNSSSPTGTGASTGGSSSTTGGGSSNACSPACSTGDVCCPTGEPCAGTCVPDCRLGTACPSGLTCDQSNGICLP